MAHITIATPMYGGMCSGSFMKSVLDLIKVMADAGHQISFIDIANESLITRARNTLTEIFLRSMSDYLLFIDADQGFESQGVLRMINEGADLVAVVAGDTVKQLSALEFLSKADQTCNHPLSKLPSPVIPS